MDSVKQKGGNFIRGKRHSEGGIPLVVEETNQHIEVEVKEPLIPKEAMQGNSVKKVSGKNIEILHEINKEVGAKGMNEQATEVHAGDAIICRNAALDEKEHTYVGTPKQIVSAINQSGGCNPIESGGKEILKNGEVIKYENGAEIPDVGDCGCGHLQKINDAFNRDLGLLIAGKLNLSKVFYLGKVSDRFKQIYNNNYSIEMKAFTMLSKSLQSNHRYDLNKLYNLPFHINNPMAIFVSETRLSRKVVLIDVYDANKNPFVIAIELNVSVGKTKKIVVNSIVSIYPKDNIGKILEWVVEDNLLEYVDSKKMLNWVNKLKSNNFNVKKLIEHCKKELASKLPPNSADVKNNSDAIFQATYSKKEVSSQLQSNAAEVVANSKVLLQTSSNSTANINQENQSAKSNNNDLTKMEIGGMVNNENKKALSPDKALLLKNQNYVPKERWANLGNNFVIESASDIFFNGGTVSEDKKNEIYSDWEKLVNMSSFELKKFYDSTEGKEAGLSANEAKSLGILRGRDSARWIMKMKDTPKEDWGKTMWAWAKHQVAFIKRMRGNKGDLYDANGNKTRKHTSLLIWGHNPEKFEDGGRVIGKRENESIPQYLNRLKNDKSYQQFSEQKTAENALDSKRKAFSFDELKLITKDIKGAFVDERMSSNMYGDFDTIFFHKYTDADKAIQLLTGKGYLVSERKSNPLNAYFKFKIIISKKKFENGGKTFDKVISASSRFRPHGVIAFNPPLIGKNGAKLVSYTWAYEWTMSPNNEGELTSKRISDWTQAEISADTGRDIVHKFTVEIPNADTKTVSSESVPILLGYTDRKELKSFPNLATAAKTLAKQQMQLAIKEAQLKEYEGLISRFEKEPKPAIVEIEEPIEFVRDNYRENKHKVFQMGDVWVRQDNPFNYTTLKFDIINQPTRTTVEDLTRSWVLKRVEENGGKYPQGLYDLRNRVERQKRKVENILGAANKFEDGGSINGINGENYFEATKVLWQRIRFGINAKQLFDEFKASGNYNYKASPHSSSEYLYNDEMAYRYADHWGQLETCDWQIDKPVKSGFILAEAKFSDFETIEHEQLLAPNGKPSNLTPEQWHLVRTPEFKAWFGDWENAPESASKMVDENGQPLTCYHGSHSSKFNVFEERYIGAANDSGFYGKGFYFTFQKEGKNAKYAINEAAYYGKNVMGCFIKAINPFDISSLQNYKGYDINFIGVQSVIFLSNLAKNFPRLADIIKVRKKTYNADKNVYEIEEVSIGILPELIEKYSKELKVFITDNNWGEKVIKSGYVKSEMVDYDYTSTGGTKGTYESLDTLGRIEFKIKDGKQYPSDEEIEFLLICDAIEKYDGISPDYNPEGYMTRYEEITEAIKEKHDCILQSEGGDELVVFQSNQIKLADGTNTTFDGNNNDIRFENGGETSSCGCKHSTYENGGVVLQGGKAEGKSVSDIAKMHGVSVAHIESQIKKGIEVEKEHTSDKSVAENIAKDHLVEIPDYYDLLEEMESKFKKVKLPNKKANADDVLSGGLANGLSLQDIANLHKVSLVSIANQLKEGVDVEMEHTSNREIAQRIAKDHLVESPKYYDLLMKLESKIKSKTRN